MLRKFKDTSLRGKALWVLVFFCLFFLCVFGIKNLLLKNRPGYYAGKIFGQKISTDKFQKAYTHVVLQNKFQYGDMFETIEPLLDLDDQAWEHLIMLKSAKDKGITVSNKEVIDEIAQYKFFFRTGKFDTLLYKRILRTAFNTDASEFEDMIRDLLIKRKLQEQALKNVTLSDKEILAAYKDHNQKMQVDYFLIPLEKFKDQVSVSDDEINAYYQENKTDFLVPLSIRVEYVKLDFPEEGGIQKQVEMKYKAKAILDNYAKSRNLSSAAATLGFNVQESDFFTRTDTPLDLDLQLKDLTNLFKAKQEEILAPIETEKGYLVIKIKERKNPHVPGLAEIHDNIKKILIEKKAREKALETAQKDRKKIIEKWEAIDAADRDFSMIVKNLGLGVDLKETPVLARKQISNTLSLSDPFKESRTQLYSLSKDNPISPALPSQNGAVVAHLITTQPLDEKKYSEKKENFAKRLLEKKKDETYTEFLKKLRSDANLTYL